MHSSPIFLELQTIRRLVNMRQTFFASVEIEFTSEELQWLGTDYNLFMHHCYR